MIACRWAAPRKFGSQNAKLTNDLGGGEMHRFAAIALAVAAMPSNSMPAVGQNPQSSSQTIAQSAPKSCPANALQILGSGGPIAEGSRAGASAIVWRNGRAVLLVDAGSGAFVRYGEAGAKFDDHDAILITHFHGDHVSDLAAILNSGGFAKRSRPLAVVGPKGNGDFPGVADHLKALFDAKAGAFRYLSGYLDGSFGLPMLKPIEADAETARPQKVFKADGIEVTAIPVHHGDVPSLGYLIEVDGKRITFAGDQSFLSEDFVAVLAGQRPDILVMHNVIPEGEGQPRGLHRWPGSIGEVAKALQPKLLVLSHNMKRALDRQAEGEAAIRQSYKGQMVVAGDLDCFPLE
jgi:ribonuclease BN (tRNA processing enzyme)